MNNECEQCGETEGMESHETTCRKCKRLNRMDALSDRAFEIESEIKILPGISAVKSHRSQTGSYYLTVVPDAGDELIIRVSDHADAYGHADYTADNVEGNGFGCGRVCEVTASF